MQKIMYALVAVFLLSIAGIVYADSIETDLTDNLVRLHIIANSDTEFDQQVKLLVRDEILSAVRQSLKDGETRHSILKNAQNFSNIAEEKLQALGVGYGATVRVENFYFPRKAYNGITLPAGWYESIRVILGEGAGENWWCVAYPPLCFTESTFGELSDEGQTLLEDQLSPESYALISNPEGVTYKFKLVEWILNIKEKL